MSLSPKALSCRPFEFESLSFSGITYGQAWLLPSTEAAQGTLDSYWCEAALRLSCFMSVERRLCYLDPRGALLTCAGLVLIKLVGGREHTPAAETRGLCTCGDATVMKLSRVDDSLGCEEFVYYLLIRSASIATKRLFG